MELNRNGNSVLVPSGTEVVFCAESSNRISVGNSTTLADEEEVNGFGLKVFKRIYPRTKRIYFNRLSSEWLLFKPSEQLKTYRDNRVDAKIPLQNHNVILAFGSLISPSEFKCAEARSYFQTNQSSMQNIFFSKRNSSISINIERSRFQLKREHIDNHRGVIIDAKSIWHIILHVCLKGNIDEYVWQNRENAYVRRLYLQNTRGGPCQPCFSTMHLSIKTSQYDTSCIYQNLCCLIQFFSHHSIPIHFGSIKFSNKNFIYPNFLAISTESFIFQYAKEMLNSVGCRMYDQIVNNTIFGNYILQLQNRNDQDFFYYIFERLRRLALSPDKYFLNLMNELPNIIKHYHEFYLDSIYYKMDRVWTNHVRIPWFCITPTRLIVKPFKFMQSNRVFRFVSNVNECMAFVEFRDDTGTSFLSEELIPFLQHYQENGFRFGGRQYISLHHAQSQVRNKQFYFYCEEEGGMTREELEAWMGNFDDERLPAKNTARRTQPFSSTEPTIEIDRKMVDIIPDLKTADGKYNFTDGVGQISSELNILIHAAIGVNVDDGDYISSVLQIRYGGCKGTVAVNPLLDGQEKQLLIRKSMDKFKCEHEMLELCKRSLKRQLCLNHEVINLLSYRHVSDTCLLVYQLRNILWLVESLVSNEAALSVLRDKVLHVLPWSEISDHPHLSQEPFFGRLLYTTISNNLYQLVTRAHIRVQNARYMFGIVDEYKVLNEGQVFVQITNEDGSRTVLKGLIAITKNPCHHPGDLRVLEAVDNEYLHHHCDVLIFPQQGSRPHASEISGSDLDGDEYTVIWDPDLIPTTPNPSPYAYDSGPSPIPLDRVVTREDRLKVISDICAQDNLGRLSNIHLVITDKLGIHSEDAVSLAGGLSQELDSVKSGQHPYTAEQIKEINMIAGTTRPDYMQAGDYEEYPSDKILGKLFRSARRLSDAFSKAFSVNNNRISLDPKLLYDDYENYIDFAQNLYRRYQYEMLEIIGSYGFSNEIDLFCCVESRNMKANERSDVQQTSKELLKAVFKDIRKKFYQDTVSNDQTKAKAAACFYIAYNDQGPKDKRMLSFPWLFASQLLEDYDSISDDDFMEKKLNSDSPVYNRLQQQTPSILNILPDDDNFNFKNLFEICFQTACATNDEQMVNQVEMVIEEIIKTAKDT